MILVFCPNPSVDTLVQLPRLQPGEIHTARDVSPYPGGKGVHVALAARELGADVELVGFWAGPTGEWIRQECERRGVSTHGPELSGWTRRCTTYIEEEGRETEIRESGATLGPNSMQELTGLMDSLLQRADQVCVSGSWPEGTPEQPYEWLADRCRDTSTPLWIDASGRWLKDALQVQPYGVHLNRSEAEEFLGEPLSAGEAARKLVPFVKVAAVTDGPRGLWVAREEETLHGECRVEHVISTVGCGDCLTGGMIVGADAQLPTREWVRLAVAAGSANCLTKEIGIIRKEDVDRLLPTVILNPASS
ncbi:MAG: 1-phosphofructokinase family hexose kinase [Bacteroidota bacterium]